MNNDKVACLMQAMIVYGRALDDNNRQLYSACKKHFGKPVLARIMDMSAYVGLDENRFWLADKQLPRIDLCFLRSFGPGSCDHVTKRISMMEHMELLGTFSVNSTQALRRAKDKYSVTYSLANAGLPVPRTYVTEMAHWAYRASQGFKQTVYKPIAGSLGFGSMKFDSVDLAFNAYKTLEHWGQPLYIQEYLEKPGRDIRAFVLGERVLASMCREAPPGKWKANVAQGARITSTRLSSELQELAVKAAKALNLLYAGVDVLDSSQGALIVEVNGSPSWQGLRRVTGVDIADKLAEFVKDYIRK